MDGKPTLLLIDDEEDNLSILEMLFSKKFNTITFSTTEEALKKIKDPDFDKKIEIIICDQVMPGLKGTEFFKEVKEFLPHTLKILLTGFKDADEIIEAINEGEIYKFISKPFNPKEFQLLVDRALETFSLREKNEELIDELKGMNEQLEEKIEERTQELIEKNISLEKANLDKHNLMRVLLHDFANTLSLITTSLHFARRRKATEPELWDKIEIASNNQQNILEHVKEIASIAAGARKINLKVLNLKDVMDEALTLLEENLKEKEINIDFKCPENFPIKAEEISLSSYVVNNVLENSIKFTPRGKTITIACEVNEKWGTMEIVDQGIGMPPRILDVIFDPTAKVTRKGTEGEKGVGFGMPLLKMYMDIFEGSVEIDSKVKTEEDEESWTRVTLKFPIGQEISQENPKAQAS